MVLADPLCHLKEEALATVKDLSTVRLFTVATLTGHVVRAYGGYPAVVPVTEPAKQISKKLAETGTLFGDPWEISSLRREDYDFVTPTSSTEDVVQANTQPSAVTARGHQYPAAFISIAAGLREHSKGSEKPLAYMHCDVAGACENKAKGGLSLGKANGGQVQSIIATFLGSEFMGLSGKTNGVNGTH
jgi:leucyl aminopeptidase